MFLSDSKAKNITPAKLTENLPLVLLHLQTLLDPALPIQDQLENLQTGNKQLHDLLQKLDKHSQDQDSELEILKIENSKLRAERDEWTSQKDVFEKHNEVLETENQLMSQRVDELEEQVVYSIAERDALDTMLKYLNDELVASELRQRKQTQSGSSS